MDRKRANICSFFVSRGGKGGVGDLSCNKSSSGYPGVVMCWLRTIFSPPARPWHIHGKNASGKNALFFSRQVCLWQICTNVLLFCLAGDLTPWNWGKRRRQRISFCPLCFPPSLQTLQQFPRNWISWPGGIFGLTFVSCYALFLHKWHVTKSTFLRARKWSHNKSLMIVVVACANKRTSDF